MGQRKVFWKELVFETNSLYQYVVRWQIKLSDPDISNLTSPQIAAVEDLRVALKAALDILPRNLVTE